MLLCVCIAAVSVNSCVTTCILVLVYLCCCVCDIVFVCQFIRLERWGGGEWGIGKVVNLS
jgi:hypothetical protein